MHSFARAQTRPRAYCRSLAAFLAGAMLLTGAAVAAAANPKNGAHFAGTAAPGEVNGFKPPVTFTVAANGKTLMKFDYSTFGCFGAGGFRPGIDYYTQPNAIIKVGNVNVLASGHFSVTGAKFSYTAFGDTTTTTSKVSGSFSSSGAASGTIVFSQKITGKFSGTCGPSTLSFSAKG